MGLALKSGALPVFPANVRISLMPAIHFTGRRPASSVEGGGAFQAGGFSVGAQRRSEQVFTVP